MGGTSSKSNGPASQPAGTGPPISGPMTDDEADQMVDELMRVMGGCEQLEEVAKRALQQHGASSAQFGRAASSLDACQQKYAANYASCSRACSAQHQAWNTAMEAAMSADGTAAGAEPGAVEAALAREMCRSYLDCVWANIVHKPTR